MSVSTPFCGPHGTCIPNGSLAPILNLTQFPANGEVSTQNKVFLMGRNGYYLGAGRKRFKILKVSLML